ncbi:MAG: GOLPH3/VPS74 family protein [Chloroflexota bacterium]
MLTLAEELLLLGMRDEEGTVASGASVALRYGLGGAVLAELLMMGRLSLNEKQRVEVVDPSPTGDELLDEVLAKVAERKRLRAFRDWVLSFGRTGAKGLQRRLLDRLVARGILREEQGRFLWLFPRREYPQEDPMPERALRDRVRGVVLHGSPPDERTLILVSLLKACRLTNEVFAKEERGMARKQIDELARGEAAGQAVSRAVAAVHAAMTSAAITVTAH